MKELLAKRKQIKRKKPEFTQQDAHKMNRLEKKWKRPRGIDSKMRLNLKGYKKKVQIGYGSPKLVRGLSKDGLKKVIVSSIKDLEGIDKKEGIVISKTVGDRKRKEILTKAKELSLTVLNMDIDKKLKSIDDNMEVRKAKKKKREKKQADKKAKEKKTEKKDKLAEKVLSEEEKVKEDKKEKDKVLTKKDNL